MCVCVCFFFFFSFVETMLSLFVNFNYMRMEYWSVWLLFYLGGGRSTTSLWVFLFFWVVTLWILIQGIRPWGLFFFFFQSWDLEALCEGLCVVDLGWIRHASPHSCSLIVYIDKTKPWELMSPIYRVPRCISSNI